MEGGVGTIFGAWKYNLMKITALEEMVMIHNFFHSEITPKIPEFLLAFTICQKKNLSLINKG